MQPDLFAGTGQRTGQNDRYEWQEGTSAGGNPYFRLIDRGEETRWWVRHRLQCPTSEPWFIVTDYGAYIGGTFADINKAKDALIAIKDGRR